MVESCAGRKKKATSVGAAFFYASNYAMGGIKPNCIIIEGLSTYPQ